MNEILSKDIAFSIIDASTKNVKRDINKEFIYDVFQIAFDSIKELYEQKQLLGNFIDSTELLQYVIGEYVYTIQLKTVERQREFEKTQRYMLQIATVAADKFLSREVLSIKEEAFTNKYLPPISSLDTYANFMLSLLNKLPKNDPEQTLILDLLSKSVRSVRCILKLLCDGFETEAMSVWRTLHENECVLILLDKYGKDLIKAYNKHISYSVSFHKGINDEEIVNQIFQNLKSELKAKGLKSKDMKKYIEYGWLYQTEESNAVGFKLNFRDGLEKCAGLSEYSEIYETSSEIIHSTPMLIYSNAAYYYMLSLINTYESFFRIESIFEKYCFDGTFKDLSDQYANMKRTYYNQLIAIHKNLIKKLEKQD